MASINLVDFFKYYQGTAEQEKAVKQLEDEMPDTLLRDASNWVRQYRAQPPAPPEPEAPKGICTPDLMHRLTGHPANSFDNVFCDDCNRLLHDTGFTSSIEASRMLMANLMHETCDFVYMKEIADGWAYEGRTDLGNTQAGDGPKFKGTGVLMLTGRFNYTRLAEELQDDLIVDRGCDYVCEQYPFRSALTWIKDNKLLNICLTEGFDDCCYRINGGWNGYEDRAAKYKICLDVFNVE